MLPKQQLLSATAFPPLSIKNRTPATTTWSSPTTTAMPWHSAASAISLPSMVKRSKPRLPQRPTIKNIMKLSSKAMHCRSWHCCKCQLSQKTPRHTVLECQGSFFIIRESKRCTYFMPESLRFTLRVSDKILPQNPL